SQPAVALPPPASPPDTVGRALASEVVASKRGARSKGPHRQSSALLSDGKRSNARRLTILTQFWVCSASPRGTGLWGAAPRRCKHSPQANRRGEELKSAGLRDRHR